MAYETPEIFELGDAEELTLAGTDGTVLDHFDFPRLFQYSVSNEGGEE